MDIKSKLVLLLLLASAVGAASITYYEYMVVGKITFFTEGFAVEEE